MSRDHTAKVFKSGNSLALRLPKSFGIVEGTEMRLREEHGRFTFEPAATGRTIDVSKFWGRIPGLQVPPREDADDPLRVWDDPDWPGWKSPQA